MIASPTQMPMKYITRAFSRHHLLSSVKVGLIVFTTYILHYPNERLITSLEGGPRGKMGSSWSE